MALRLASPRAACAAAVLAATGLVAAGPAWGATSTSTTTTTPTSVVPPGPSTTASATSTSTTEPPSSTTAPTTTSSTTSTTVSPATLPPVGARVNNLQLDAINAQFVADVQAEVGAAQDGLDLARSQLTKAQAAAATASAALAAENQRLQSLDTAQRQQALALQKARARLRDLAIDAYVSGGPGAPIEQLLGSGDINQFARREGYLSAVATASNDAVTTYARARETSTRTARATVDDLQRALSAKATAESDVLSAQAAVTDATTVLNDRQQLLTLTSDAISSPNTDIPRMVLDAYQRAALAVQAKGCHLAWWGLAGIGKVESDHGRDEHAHLAANGDLVPHIVGVPLTGKNGTVLVQDPNGYYAHAEGPMQFIPSTWEMWAADGNGDGILDVDNVYDATLGAANYLCATSTDLETDAGLQAAYFSYNHSNDYVTEVLAYAKSYEEADVAGLIPPLAPAPLWSLAPPTTTTTVPAAPTSTTTTSTSTGL